jgi:uncharacterized membrane protein YsdA (DUF1294 family)
LFIAPIISVGQVSLSLGLFYLTLSIVTFILYARDKSAAINGAWRTPEIYLHLCSLLGGWPGAMIAQKWRRHKSSKHAFQGVFWLTVTLNILTFAYFLTR